MNATVAPPASTPQTASSSTVCNSQVDCTVLYSMCTVLHPPTVRAYAIAVFLSRAVLYFNLQYSLGYSLPYPKGSTVQYSTGHIYPCVERVCTSVRLFVCTVRARVQNVFLPTPGTRQACCRDSGRGWGSSRGTVAPTAAEGLVVCNITARRRPVNLLEPNSPSVRRASCAATTIHRRLPTDQPHRTVVLHSALYSLLHHLACRCCHIPYCILALRSDPIRSAQRNRPPSCRCRCRRNEAQRARQPTFGGRCETRSPGRKQGNGAPSTARLRNT